ncbi:MAG: ABC transporter substrate-binding protein [Gammaproteobacteria bacterium]|nr:ABC transporter substrate-binding protein [Gammaproteobacteria bacterium]
MTFRNKALGLAAAAAMSAGTAPAADLVIAGRDGGYANALSMAVEAFQDTNPGVDVDRLELPYGGLLEKVTISMRERANAYDVIMLDDTWATEFMSRGWLANLDELGGGIDADFISAAVDVSRYPVGSGPLYAVPFVGNVEMFAYRSDLMDRPESWTDVLEAAKRISGLGGDVSGVVFRGIKANPIVTGFLPILWAHGARVVDDDGQSALNSPEALEALNLYLELKKYAPRGVETYNSSEVRDALMQGTTAMSIELWPSWAPSLDDPEKSRVPGKIEVIAAPGQNVGSSPMLGSWLLAVPADAPNPEIGRKFIDFITSAEFQKKLALEIGQPPTRTSVYSDDDVVAKYRWYPNQLAALENATPRPRIKQWNKVETILGDYLQLALIGDLDPEVALEEADAQIAKALSR